jgi:hypothetical protein
MEAAMGGIGSGGHRSTCVGNVEDALALDIRALRRLGLIRPGECVIDMVQWSIGGLGAFRARLRIDLSDIERGGTMTITGEMADDTISQHIAIDGVASSFGGHRCYFRCAITGERCEILYLVGGLFASRSAHRLSYAVQNMTDLSRARRRATKLRRRLRGEGGLPRPRGRKRIKIALRLDDAECKARMIYFDRLAATGEWSGSRRMPRHRRR